MVRKTIEREAGVPLLDPFMVSICTEDGMREKPAYGRFGPLVVSNAATDQRLRLYTITHEETGLRCGPIFSDGLLACAAARELVKVLGAEFFVSTDGGSKGAQVLRICQHFLDQEGETGCERCGVPHE